MSKFNKRFRFLLCVIDIFAIFNAFQKVLDDSKRRPNKIWVDKSGEFYNNSFRKWLQDNDIAIYSTHNEGKSVVAERFIRTLKTKFRNT